jgi:hypothetical protein
VLGPSLCQGHCSGCWRFSLRCCTAKGSNWGVFSITIVLRLYNNYVHSAGELRAQSKWHMSVAVLFV